MERGSAQHGPRVDEELAAETEPMLHSSSLARRDREDLEPEVPAADEPGADPDVKVTEPEPEGPPHEEVLARSELARWLLPSAFPARASTLATVARRQGAPDDVVAPLEALESTRIFETVGELWIALGGAHEERSTPVVEPAPEPTEPKAERAPVPETTPEPERPSYEPTGEPVAAAATAPTGALPLRPEPESPIATVVSLITLPPRIAFAAIGVLGRAVGRTIVAVTHSDDPPSS
jgi:hypothetical protein